MTGTPMSSIHFKHVPRSLPISILLGILLPSSMAFFTRFPKNIAGLDFPIGSHLDDILQNREIYAQLLIEVRDWPNSSSKLEVRSPLEPEVRD